MKLLCKLLVFLLVMPSPLMKAEPYGAVGGCVVLWGGGEFSAELIKGLDSRLPAKAVPMLVGDAPKAVRDWIISHGGSMLSAAEVTVDRVSEMRAIWVGDFANGDRERLGPLLRQVARRGGLVGGALTGLDVIPGLVIDPRICESIEISDKKLDSNLVLGVPQGSTVLIDDRDISCLGASAATWRLPGNREPRTVLQTPGTRQDLVALLRAARARTTAEFPRETAGVPQVTHGTLIIAGGGELPGGVWARFIERAGGPDAPIVVIPVAQPDPDIPNPKGVKELKAAGARNVTVLSQRSRSEIESADFQSALRNAKGIWFVGGRQWRLVDAYEQTSALELFHDVLRRGGVIGGTSAGAAIQAEYMVRGSPMGYRAISAEGYEQGFGFLPGTAIDTHVSERQRLAQLQGLIQRYPQYLGLGFDEKAACEVSGGMLTAIGEGAIWVVDAKRNADSPLALRPSERYDLVRRRIPDGKGD